MHFRGWALPLALLAVATPLGAAQLHTVATGDPADGKALTAVNAALAFTDLNSNGRADVAEPDETVYLDVDGSRSVTYADLRLSPFLSYGAGTTVDATNGDVGRGLTSAGGWLASTPAGHWFADVDGSRSVSAGDIRLSTSFGAKVAAGDSDVRTSLEPAQTAVSSSLRVGYLDTDVDGQRDASEPLYFDMDPNGSPGNGKVSTGDLQLLATGPGRDDAPTRMEFEQALDELGIEEGSDGTYQRDPDSPAAGGSTWGVPETVLLVLGLANLAGLVLLYRRESRPRNPFK